MAKAKLVSLTLTLLVLLSATATLAQVWGLQGQQLPWQQFGPFGQSSPQRLRRGQQLQNDCQINKLTASEPTKRVESEAGITEFWEPNEQQELQCAGVAVVRHQIESRGLLLPYYVNAPALTYVVKGRGILGVNIPGCPETFESGTEQSFSEQGRRERGFESSSDQHQKVRRIRQGDIIALPSGVSKWIYSEGEERLTTVTLYDTKNFQNQLDENLSVFFLAGNPQEGGQRSQRGRHEEMSRHQTRRHGRRSEQSGGQNIFNGFDEELLAEAFGVDRETINQIQGQNDNRGTIVRVERELQILSPEFDQDEERARERRQEGGRSRREEEWRERRGRGGRQEEEEEERRERRSRGGRQEEEIERRERRRQEEERERRERRRRGSQKEEEEEERRERRRQGGRGRGSCNEDNGLEETMCSLRLKHNIDNPESADEFNPHGGRLTSLNSHKLPILNFLQLSAEKVNLYQNAILAPHWRINAHSICYFTKGEGRVQVVNNQGELIFDDNVNEGQLLVVPQNFAVVKKAGGQGLEYVTFFTNDNAMINPLAGRISAIRGMPLEVVMNSYGVSREDATKLKYNRPELTVFSPSRTDRRGEQFAIV